MATIRSIYTAWHSFSDKLAGRRYDVWHVLLQAYVLTVTSLLLINSPALSSFLLAAMSFLLPCCNQAKIYDTWTIYSGLGRGKSMMQRYMDLHSSQHLRGSVYYVSTLGHVAIAKMSPNKNLEQRVDTIDSCLTYTDQTTQCRNPTQSTWHVTVVGCRR